SISRLPNGNILLRGLCSPNSTTTVLEAAPNVIGGGSFALLAPVAPDASGVFSFEDGASSLLNRRFYRLLTP
ncbi:MAG TPA: hypothetical protein VF683_00875, partial [Chthoniobacterales bacterium]